MTHPYHPQCGCATRRHMLGWAALASIGAITGLTGLTGCSQADNSSAQSLKPVEIDGATSCELDGMLLADYPGPKAQVRFAGQDKPSFFCDTVELFATLLAGEQVRAAGCGWAGWLREHGYIRVSCSAPPLRSTMAGVISAKRSTLPPYSPANFFASASCAKLPMVGPMEPWRLLPST